MCEQPHNWRRDDIVVQRDDKGNALYEGVEEEMKRDIAKEVAAARPQPLCSLLAAKQCKVRPESCLQKLNNTGPDAPLGIAMVYWG